MRKIPLHGKNGKGKSVIVDDEDFEWASKHKWHLEIYDYASYVITRRKNKPRIYLHKEIARAGKGQMVYLKKAKELDYRRENLICPDDWKNIPMEIDEITGGAKIWLHGKLGEGKYSLVDIEDWEKVVKWEWQLAENGYARRTGNKAGKQFSVLMHRVIMNDPECKQIDHFNGIKRDNRKINLRLCNNSQNNQNRFMQKNNTTGYKGIEKNPKKQKWRAKIVLNGKRYCSKHYDTKIDAAKEYDRLARKYHGGFARTNF